MTPTVPAEKSAASRAAASAAWPRTDGRATAPLPPCWAGAGAAASVLLSSPAPCSKVTSATCPRSTARAGGSSIATPTTLPRARAGRSCTAAAEGTPTTSRPWGSASGSASGVRGGRWAGLGWTGLDWAAPAQGLVAGWERGAALLRSQLRGGVGGGRAAVLKDVKGNGACRRLLLRAALHEPTESTPTGPGTAVVLGPPTPPHAPLLPRPQWPGLGSPRGCRPRACGHWAAPSPFPPPTRLLQPGCAVVGPPLPAAGRQRLGSPGHHALRDPCAFLLGDFNQHTAPSWERGLSLVRTGRYC